jgi:hypothetical protein
MLSYRTLFDLARVLPDETTRSYGCVWYPNAECCTFIRTNRTVLKSEIQKILITLLKTYP